MSYTYDARDNVTSILYPSGRKVSYSYNSASQVTQVGVQDGARVNVLAANIINLPLGPAQSWTYGNNLVEARTYNTQYLPS